MAPLFLENVSGNAFWECGSGTGGRDTHRDTRAHTTPAVEMLMISTGHSAGNESDLGLIKTEM